jgi:hypothetical protein
VIACHEDGARSGHFLDGAHPNGLQHVPDGIEQSGAGCVRIHEADVGKAHPESKRFLSFLDFNLLGGLSEPIRSDVLFEKFTSARKRRR